MTNALVCVFLISFLTLACQPKGRTEDVKAVPPPVNPRKPVVESRAILFGDSLATGMGASRPENNLAACLTKITGATSLVRAENGADTARTLQQVQKFRTDTAGLVFLSVGGNDVIRDLTGSSYPESESLRNFEAILSELEPRKTRVVYLMLNPPFSGASRLPLLAAKAQARNIIVVDGMDGLWNQRQYMADQIHPNDAGYKIICDRIKDTLKNLPAL